MRWRLSAVALLTTMAGWPALASTIVTCGGLSSDLSCASFGPAGSSVRASARENYSIANGIFSYQANAQLSVVAPHFDAGGLANQTGSIAVTSVFDLSTDGPVRSGYLDLFGNTSQVSADSSDSSVTASASYRIQIGDVYRIICANGHGCFLPVYEAHPISILLGEPLRIEIVGQGNGNSFGGEPGFAGLLSDLQFGFFECDGMTRASITSFRVVTPEPATWVLALPCILLMILANLRMAYRRKRQPPEEQYKRIGRGAARRRYLEQRRGI